MSKQKREPHKIRSTNSRRRQEKPSRAAPSQDNRSEAATTKATPASGLHWTQLPGMPAYRGAMPAAQPISAEVVAAEFRHLAEGYERIADARAQHVSDVDRRHESQLNAKELRLDNEAGQAALSAYRGGFFTLEGMETTARWHDSPDSEAALGGELRGRGRMPKRPDNVWCILAGELLPAAYPDHFPEEAWGRPAVDRAHKLSKACRLMAGLMRIAGGKQNNAGRARRGRLTNVQLRVYEVLNALPPEEAATAAKIVEMVYNKYEVNMDESTIRKHIIPALQKKGYPVRNDGDRAGYYLADTE